MDGVTFRGATIADAGAVAGLVTQLGYPTERTDMEHRLDALLSRSDYIAIVAEMSGDIVGLAGAAIGSTLELDAQYGLVTGLVVDEHHRHQGIGRLLMQHIENLLRNRGAVLAVLTSGNQRAEAHHFYKGLGYEITGVRFAKRL